MDQVYFVVGDLDAAGVKANLSVFPELAAQKTDVTIDMSAVESIDGSGIGALVFVYKRLRCAGQQVRLINVRSQPLSVLEKLGLTKLFSASSNGAFTVVPAAERVTEHLSKTWPESSNVQPKA